MILMKIIWQRSSSAVRRGSADLHQWLNSFIFLVKQSGELDALTRKHLGVPAGDLPVF